MLRSAIVLLRAGKLEIVWRLSYAIILVLISFMVLWRIFRVKESAQWKKRNAGAHRHCCYTSDWHGNGGGWKDSERGAQPGADH